jgi:2-haloacid dehalogenase
MQQKNSMKNIIFDLGGVLVLWDPDIIYKKYFANDLTKMRRFYEETGIRLANIDMDRGRPFQEVLTELSHKFPQYHEAIHLWQTKWLSMIAGPIADSVRLLESLHSQGYALYALTNWSAETFFPYIRHNQEYKFLNLFKDIIVSGIEQTTKPDLKIYKILLQRNNLNPANCIYIDDCPENLIPAQNLGMSTIKFNSPKQLGNKLKSQGISVTNCRWFSHC